VGRVEVLDQHEGHAGVRGQRAQDLTEGLEPAVTEELVKLIVSATGGRVARSVP